jgi:hypothetical protein
MHQDYLMHTPGRTRKAMQEPAAAEGEKKTKEEVAAERKMKRQQKKNWSGPVDTIDERIMPFLERHANEMRSYIEATFV